MKNTNIMRALVVVALNLKVIQKLQFPSSMSTVMSQILILKEGSVTAS